MSSYKDGSKIPWCHLVLSHERPYSWRALSSIS